MFKKNQIITYIAVVSVLITILMNTDTILLGIRILYMSCIIEFNSDFESGSIGKDKLIYADKIKLGNKKSRWRLIYEITSKSDPQNSFYKTVDPNTRWFYFRITSVKDKLISLKFKLTDPVHPVYSYDNIHFERFSDTESNYRIVSKVFTKDTVYIAYYIPYNYNYLQKRILQWRLEKNIVTIDTIGWNSQKRPLQIIKITDPSIPDSCKKRIYIHGRIHPSETPSSWYIDGLIEAILSHLKGATEYRKHMIFYILPFANPDGVFAGLSRSNINGIDLENNYDADNKHTSPEVNSIKKAIKNLCENHPLDLVLNIHSQTKPQLTFWIHSQNSTSKDFFCKQLLFVYHNISLIPFFNKEDLSYSDLPEKCIEGWIWEKYKDQTLALTFETPYTYYNDVNKTLVTTNNLKSLGFAALTAIGDYFHISTPEHLLIDPSLCNVNQKKIKLNYKVEDLPKGHYYIYSWNPLQVTTLNSSNNTGWTKIGQIDQLKNGELTYIYKAAEIGVMSNTVLFDSYPDTYLKLKKAYPKFITDYSNGHIILNNNTWILFDDSKNKNHYELLENADIEDMFKIDYPKKAIKHIPTNNSDPGRYRNEDLFKSMYGFTKQEVERNLVEMVWCPKLVNQKIRVTSVNKVSDALYKISRELDEHPEWTKYLNAVSTYNWRNIVGSDKLSTHSFGIAIDLNTKYNEYWKWDNPVKNENDNIIYKNNLPSEIVEIFAKFGFIWGGNWYHYDTMHFEYRPELF